MRRYCAKLREAGNLPIEARVGVNTGEVVVRSLKTGATQTEYTPIGHSISLAARMQVLADRVDRGHRNDAQALRGLLHFQAARTDPL
jgi:class 3 adenylate cyclase